MAERSAACGDVICRAQILLEKKPQQSAEDVGAADKQPPDSQSWAAVAALLSRKHDRLDPTRALHLLPGQVGMLAGHDWSWVDHHLVTGTDLLTPGKLLPGQVQLLCVHSGAALACSNHSLFSFGALKVVCCHRQLS